MADLDVALKGSVPVPAKPTIMLVDDDVLLRMMVADELRQHGYTVVEAATGDEALAILNSGTNVDLVLTDVKMPGKTDGLALARHLRGQYPMTKIVMLSGEHSVVRDVTGVADAFHSKPCDMPALLASIDNLVRPSV